MCQALILKKVDPYFKHYRGVEVRSTRAAAKKRGVRFGRPEKMNEEQKLLAKRLLQEDKSVNEVAKIFNVHKATIYRLQDLK